MPKLTTRLLNTIIIFGLIILIVSASFAIYQNRQTINANKSVIHTYQVMDRVSDLLFSLTRTELVAYDYVIKNDNADLLALQNLYKNIDANITTLTQLTRDNPIQQKNIRILKNLVLQYEYLINNILLVNARQGRSAALMSSFRKSASDQLNTIMQMVNAIDKNELALLTLRNANLQRSTHLSLITLWTSGLIGLIFLIFSLGLLRYLQAKRTIAEQERFELEGRLKKIIDGSRDLIAAVDESGKFIAFNKAYLMFFKKEFGQTLEIGMPIQKAFGTKTKGNEAIAAWQRALEGNEFITITEYDSTIYETTFSISRDQSGKQIAAAHIMRDITERNKVDRLKNEFISVVSHELRTPLTSIKGSLGLILNGTLGQLNEKIVKMLNIAYKNCERLIHIINDILDIEKIDSGNTKFKMEDVDLVKLIKESIEANQVYAHKYNIKLVFIAPDKPYYVNVDYGRMMQVMANLISNAVKFSYTRQAVDIAINQKGQFVRISVTDYGPGIPEEFQEHIFKRFSQEDSSAVRKQGGSGLGLNITKSIIQKMGGEISFTTKKNHGTTFYFDLPLLPDQSAKTQKPQQESVVSDSREHSILYIEDDVDLAEIILQLINKEGKVEWVTTKKQAEEIMQRKSFDLVILDIVLSDGSGVDLLPLFHRLNIPVVAFSVDEIAKKYADEVCASLIKSKTSDKELVETIRKALKTKTSSPA